MKARLPQGMGKGPSNNMNQMLKQAQKMQDEITALQADLEQREFTGTAGGGVVEVTINGKRNVLKLDIKPEVVDPEDVEKHFRISLWRLSIGLLLTSMK